MGVRNIFKPKKPDLNLLLELNERHSDHYNPHLTIGDTIGYKMKHLKQLENAPIGKLHNLDRGLHESHDLSNSGHERNNNIRTGSHHHSSNRTSKRNHWNNHNDRDSLNQQLTKVKLERHTHHANQQSIKLEAKRNTQREGQLKDNHPKYPAVDSKIPGFQLPDESFAYFIAICEGIAQIIKFFSQPPVQQTNYDNYQNSRFSVVSDDSTRHHSSSVSKPTLIMIFRVGMCLMTLMSYPILGFLLFL